MAQNVLLASTQLHKASIPTENKRVGFWWGFFGCLVWEVWWVVFGRVVGAVLMLLWGFVVVFIEHKRILNKQRLGR